MNLRAVILIKIIAALFFNINAFAKEPLIENVIISPMSTSQYLYNYYENDKDIVKKQVTDEKGFERTYYLYPAVESAKNKAKPLIILLHGSNRSGISMIDMWRNVANNHGVILVAPNSYDPQNWKQPKDNAKIIQLVIKEAEKNYNIDKKRIYLFGHSSGAIFALSVGAQLSKDLAAIGVHAGMFMNSDDSKVLASAKRKIPYTIFVGMSDDLFPVDKVRKTAQSLQNAGFPVELNLIKYHDHWYYNLAPFINEKAWEFFEKNKY
mgnify:CR=1 FL=1